MSNSYHCKICEIHVSVKKNWIQHLLKPEHQSNAKKCSQEWDRKMRKRILVTFCEEGFDKPTSFLTRVIRYFSVGDVSSVANFIRRKEKPHVGIVQFESRKKLKEMLSSLKSRHLFKINNRVIQIKRAIRVSDMEWNVLIGSTRGIEKLMWGKDSRPWKSILSTPEESGKVHVVTISDNEDDDDEEIEVIQHLCAVKKAVTPASDNAVSTSDAGNELKQPTETSVVKSNDEVERPANKKRKTDNEAKKSSSSSSPKSSCPTGILARLVKKNRWKKPKFELSFLNPSAPGHVVKYLFRVKLNGTIYEPNLSAASTSKKMARHNAVSYCLKCLKKAPNSRTREVPIIAAEADSNSNVTNVTIVAQKDAAGVTVAAADSTTSPENSPESPDIIILSNEEVDVAPSLTVPKSLTPEVTESKRSKSSISDEAEANKNKSVTSEEPESSKRKSSNAKHDEAEKSKSTTSKEPDTTKRKSQNSKQDETHKNKSTTSKEPESSKRRSSNSKHDEAEKTKSTTTKELELIERKSPDSKYDEAQKNISTTSKEPVSSRRKTYNSKHDEGEKNKSTTSKEPESSKRKSSNSKHDEAEKDKSVTSKEPESMKRKSPNSKHDETHKNKSVTSKEPELMERKSSNSQHDEGQKNKATTSKEPEPTKIKSRTPKPDEAQKNNSTTPKSAPDRHSKQLNSDFDFSAIFKSATGKEGPAGTKSKVYQAQVTKNSVQKTVESTKTDLQSPSVRVPSINLPLLENQFTSIIKSIEIPMEEFNVALSLVQRIESCLVSDYRPSCKVTMFRNWHLQLRHSGSNDLLIYVYSLEDGNGTSNFNSLPVEAVANVLLKTTKGRTLLPDIKPLPSKDKTIGRQFVHSPTGLSFQIVTPAWYIVEVQMCRLVRYLCQFDPRCKPLITLVYYWAKVNNVQVGQTVNPSMHYNAPEPAALEWLVISFLVSEKVIPSAREALARSKHLPLLVFDSRSDIGFARNEEFRREWISSRPPIQNNIWNVLILAEKFFSFMSSNLHPSSNWLVNTRDGEILNLKYFATNTAWSEKLGVVEQMALRELATHPEKAQRVNLKNFEGLYVMHPLYLTWRLSVCNEPNGWRLTNGIAQETSKELKKVVKLQADQALNGNITEAPFDLKAVLEVKRSVILELERKIHQASHLDKSKRNSSSKNSKSSTIPAQTKANQQSK